MIPENWAQRGDSGGKHRQHESPGQRASRAGAPAAALPNWTTWTTTSGLKAGTHHPGRVVVRKLTSHLDTTPLTATGNDVHTDVLLLPHRKAVLTC